MFEVNKGTISWHFHSTVKVIYLKTKPLNTWPNLEVLRLTTPTTLITFFKKSAVAIDCTEIFVECPSDLLARAQV